MSAGLRNNVSAHISGTIIETGTQSYRLAHTKARQNAETD
jgi:hypothetical protein